MSNINKAAVLNPLPAIIDNIVDYVPRATTSKFGVVALGSGINVDAFGRIYLDTQEYSDRLAAIEAEAASTLATQKSEVAAAIAQVNLAQSQTITALTLEISNLKTDLITSVTATQAELTNRIGQLTQDVTDSIEVKQTEFSNRTHQIVQEVNDSITAIQTNFNNQTDQLIQDVTDITEQLTQDKETFTQEIQNALDYLKDDASVASALRTPRKIQTIPFDGTQDINLPTFTSEIDGLVPKRVGSTTTKYLREDGGWVVPPTTTYSLLTQANAEAGTSTAANTISAKVLKDAILYHTPVVTDITGNAGTATKLQTSRTVGGVSFDGTANINLPGVNIAGNQDTSGNAATTTKLATARTINGVSFDGSSNITLPLASTSVSGTVQLNNTLTSTVTNHALTAAQGKVLNDSKLGKTENAVSASKLQTSRTISLTGGVTGSVSFDGSTAVSIATTVTGLGAANGIATLDSNGQVPSTQLPSYVDDVLEYGSVAAFPATGVTGKIYVETSGNTTYRWGGTSYVKITSGEVASVAGKVGVVTLTKSDVGLSNVDNTADSAKSVATATKLATARTIGGVSFDGSTNISLPGVNTAGNQNTSGNAATATQLQTARTINDTSFDGAANITTANWGTARTLSYTGDVTGSSSVNGSTNVATAMTLANTGVAAGTYKSITVDTKGRVTAGTNIVTGLVTSTAATGTSNTATTNTNTFLNIVETIGTTPSTVGTSTQVTGAGTVTVTSDTAGKLTITGSQTITGNAATATKLATACTINGVSFNGTSNITVPTVDIVSIAKGGTGGTDAAGARANLGLGSAATLNAGVGGGDLPQVAKLRRAFGTISIPSLLPDGWDFNNLSAGDYVFYGASSNPNSPPTPHISLYVTRNFLDEQLTVVGHDYFTGGLVTRAKQNGYWGLWAKHYHTLNTTINGNGYIVPSSPTIKIHPDSFELNEDSKKLGAVCKKLGVGHYEINNVDGFHQEGWYFDIPTDRYKNPLIAADYEYLPDERKIVIKAYAIKANTFPFEPDLDTPMDVPQGRWIDVRLYEPEWLRHTDLPKPEKPVVDNEGNAAPSRLHELVEGVWVISDENAAILEQERLAAMKPLKRRQFRLTLAMNGYDLNEIEALIDQIEDPMQRTIAQIEWQDATDFERTNPTLLMTAQTLGLTSEQVDSLWEYGLTL